MSNQFSINDKPMYVSTTDEIAGFKILQHYGLVYGATVRARGLGGIVLQVSKVYVEEKLVHTLRLQLKQDMKL